MTNKNNIAFGMLILGATGALIGAVVHSVLLSIVAGILGLGIGAFVGWLGGRRFLLIICGGALIGAAIGYQSGDHDILIMASGSGAAIAGFVGAQVERFFSG
ncbi:MAG: hypothetical protein ACQ9MH_05660 [Nitrospinales bacterium]